MKAVRFPQVTNMVAENQDEYNTLPSFVGIDCLDEQGKQLVNISCFELDDNEVARIVKYKKIWHRALTFGGALQPFNIFAVKDYFNFNDTENPNKILVSEILNGITIFQKIRIWAKERGLYDKGDVKTQYVKLGEEFGELGKAIINNDNPEIEDAIGDIVVVLTNLAHLHGTDIEKCISSAYNEIKNRKGSMQNGSFIKEIQELEDNSDYCKDCGKDTDSIIDQTGAVCCEECLLDK